MRQAEHEEKKVVCPIAANCSGEYCRQVLIPGGIFVMGQDSRHPGKPPEYFGGLATFGDPGPAHEVFLEPFCIDVYEVTVERYEHCVRAGECDPGDLECSTMPETFDYKTKVNHYPDKCENRGELCPNYPVNCKSYRQASDYCHWIGRRLCTEAEWERAASGPGPGKKMYPWGQSELDETRANSSPHGPGHLMPVGSYPRGKSPEGVYDLVGNVYEWVSDYYAPYPAETGGPVANPCGPGNGNLRLGRGGCFLTTSVHSSTERTTFDPDFDWGCIGIRCCATAVPALENTHH